MKALRYTAMIALAALALLPLYWLLISSIRPAADIFRYGGTFSWRTLLPSQLTLENYAELTRGDFPRALGNSMFVSDAAGLGLHYAPAQRTSVPLTLGARFDTAFTVAGRSASVSAKLGWAHEFNPNRSLQAAFSAAAGAGFQVLGVRAAANAAVVELNGTLAVTRNVALFGTFTGRFAGIETAVGGFGGLQVKW